MVPGQQSHHSSDEAEKVEHGVGHLPRKDPVWVGWRVTGDADCTVGKCHNEVQHHTTPNDYQVNRRLQQIQKISIRYIDYNSVNENMSERFSLQDFSGSILCSYLETHPGFDLY